MNMNTVPVAASPVAVEEAAVRMSMTLSGGFLLRNILDLERPEVFVRGLSGEDFFWIVKRIGEDDCLPVLELASEEQWQYLLDLEIWDKDQLNPKETLLWFSRLAEADQERFSSWIITGECDLFSLLLLRTAQVVLKEKDEGDALPPPFFTFDGCFYVKALRAEEQDILEKLLRNLARTDYERYQALLHGLAGIIPAEAEEELYRLRNGRISEHGFLPFEEAVGIYAPLDPSALGDGPPPPLPGTVAYPECRHLIPLSPILIADERGLISRVLSRIDDSGVLDRIRQEFSDICNRIIAAEAPARIGDSGVIARACGRAAAFLKLALNCVCADRADFAEQIIRNHSIQTIFRVGFGFAAALNREASRWRRESWYVSRGWDNDFWGSPWGENLEGLLASRPRFFVGGGSGELYRDFETARDLDEARRRLRHVQALDALLARLSPGLQREVRNTFQPVATFHFLLFNQWACSVLEKEISFSPLEPAEAVRFFKAVRRNDKGPPYPMSGFREIFISDFMQGVSDFEPPMREALAEALSMVWDAFRMEYEFIEEDDLEGRYSPFLLISLPGN